MILLYKCITNVFFLLYKCIANDFDIRGAFNKFPDFFFVRAFKIVVDSWEFCILLQYIL